MIIAVFAVSCKTFDNGSRTTGGVPLEETLTLLAYHMDDGSRYLTNVPPIALRNMQPIEGSELKVYESAIRDALQPIRSGQVSLTSLPERDYPHSGTKMHWDRSAELALSPGQGVKRILLGCTGMAAGGAMAAYSQGDIGTEIIMAGFVFCFHRLRCLVASVSCSK